MMRRDEDKSDYYRRRAEFEASVAERCDDPKIRSIHDRLASMYRARATDLATIGGASA